ncbi:MAG: hypothetical protein K9J74_03820, partial [Sulfuritalea sp.]|nr:hypothetical protein [Sulfuritalea sp.]
AAQTILRRATDARPFDYQPPFYYGFNLVQFLNDPLGAANWMRSAAQRMLDPDARLMMEDFAARWLGRSSDLELAANIVDAMAAQAKRKDFAEYLHKRSKRLRDLALLRKAAEAYTLRFGKSPGALDDLLNNGFVTTIPTDPFGIGYVIDKAGIPVILDSRKK